MGTRNTGRQPRNDRLRRSPLFLLRGRALAIAVTLVLTLVTSCASGGPELQSVADRFSASVSWVVLGDAEVTEALCFGPDCKTVVMAWSTSTLPTAEEFDSLMHRAGWADVEIDDCQARPDVTGPVPFCRASASSGDVRIELSAAGPLAGEANPYRITLRVGPR